MIDEEPMYIICADMEGIFTPEIWINVAEKTGIKELRLTTRDISDYDVLMKRRLAILDEHHLKLKDITNVILSMEPLEGALDFLNWLRSKLQVIIVSDTFVEFAGPLLEKLGRPTLFCHCLAVNSKGMIVDYKLRQPDAKRQTAVSLKQLKYSVIGIGDSYNDINMLKESDAPILFRPPQNVKNEYSRFPDAYDYNDLKKMIVSIATC